MDFKKIRAKTKMNQKSFAEYFDIPVRTLQDWEHKKRTPPEYVVELIEYKIKKERLGMLKLIVKDHGEEEILKEGTFEEILEYLKENENIINWVLDEDPKMILPNLDGIEDLSDLENEFKKIDLGWWTLEIEKI